MLFTVQKSLRQKLSVVLIAVIGIYLMTGISLYLLQEKLMFLPEELAQNYEYTFNEPFQEVFLQPEEGVSINAIHFKTEKPKGVILYFHGNAGNLSRWGIITEYFVQIDYDVFVMDYRTYGKSEGELSEAALYSDAQYCYTYLKEMYDEEEIIIYGRSLGTGIASHVAQNNTPKMLFLETPFFSIADVARSRFPLFPISALLKYKLPTFQHLKGVHCPIVIIHGTEDKVVPYASGKKLEKLDLPNTIFVSISGGSHNNLIQFETYHKTIRKYLK